MRRIELPITLFFAWIILTLALMGQGLHLAADRQAEREPVRPPTLVAGATLEIAAGTRELLCRDVGPEALAVYQELPERNLIRWVERGTGAGEFLLIPLEGLGPGHYALAAAPAAAGPASQEMDQPQQTLRPWARFRILPQ